LSTMLKRKRKNFNHNALKIRYFITKFFYTKILYGNDT
jgi:hypothetical protein